MLAQALARTGSASLLYLRRKPIIGLKQEAQLLQRDSATLRVIVGRV